MGLVRSRVSPDIIGCVWTGEFHLNTLRERENVLIQKEKVADMSGYLDMSGRGLNTSTEITG